MRYKALSAFVRFAPPPSSPRVGEQGPAPGDAIRRWVATLVMVALIPAIILPILFAQAGTAVLSVAPATTVSGASITARGTGFAPRSRGILRLDALATTGVTYRADGSGGFAVAFRVPGTTPPGNHTLFATGSGKNKAPAATLASVSFVVAAPVSSPPPPSAAATTSVAPSASPKPTASGASSPGATPTAPPSATPAPPVPASTPSPASSAPGATSGLQFPIRAAFYYPWFPEGWNQQGLNPFTHFHPSLGYYDGSSPTVIRSQIAAMQYGNIAAGIASWWGIGTKTDQRVPALLQAASGTGFRWAIYYEAEGWGNPSVAQISADLAYVAAHYGADPSYLRINGRLVVFVYGDGSDSCATADRWRLANTVGAYVVLKVFSGYRTCGSQPDGWHQYGPASATDSQAGYSFAISPGFFKANESTARLVRDIGRWSSNVQQMVASGAPFQLITTFNEWGEGTSVESAAEWQTPSGYGAYLDALHRNGVP